MSRIQDEFLKTVIYLYPSEEDADNGTDTGGAGCLVTVPSVKIKKILYVYAATNKHVIHSAKSPVVRLNRIDGSTEIFPFKQNDWTDHPDQDDISIVPISLDLSKHKVKAISSNMFINKEIILSNNIGLGDEAYMLVRLPSYDGKSKNIPLACFGNISMMPDNPVKHSCGLFLESFLVDMRSTSGNSGSPTFVHIPPFSLRQNGGLLDTNFSTYFLGINWGHIDLKDKVINKNSEKLKEHLSVKRNSGIACIVPAWKLLGLLNLEKFKAQRDINDQKIELSII